MDFESWWDENWFSVCEVLLIKDRAEMVWKASRENQKEYQKYEFCLKSGCNHADFACPPDPHKCTKTAKEFHHWLKEHGYRIVKEAKS